MRKRFGIAGALTDRDRNAPTLEDVLNLPAPSNLGRNVLRAQPSPVEDDVLALSQAGLAPLNDFQAGLHVAAAHLVPLIHGVSVADHIASLLGGFKPTLPQALNASEALPYMRNILGKLLP